MSTAIHKTMTEIIDVPHDDYFQVVHQHQKGEFFYDPSYLQVERTDDLIYVHFTLKNSRTAEQKKAFYHQLASRLHEDLEIRKEDVFIMLSGNTEEDWSFGNGMAQMIRET
ncbi:tautomerase family protein [Bacillus nakamurai]|uniref:tautomerase family protein n=1 Tax=Bacillus nakamurai TaxID=1793963 RepID=UPI001E46FE0F|nr:tautomerase family protein [Bacillus nakamurai]MCC9023169.1 tautomerase family protein [Bacillus nakamurai]